MITSDSHMHTRFSTDSDADIRDMIESALKKGKRHMRRKFRSGEGLSWGCSLILRDFMKN